MKRAAAALCALGWATGAGASELFRVGEVEGVFNASVSYGILARVEERRDDFVGVANGGSARSVNLDDGDLNYDEGIVANQVRGSAELALRWRNFGAFVRGTGFYDFETELGGGRRTSLSADGRRALGRGGDLQDAYLTADFRVVDVPVQLRVGRQVINWGEGGLLRFGVDVVNPVDLVAAAQPTTTARDLFVRQGMVWGVANLTETVAVEAFYQYEWEPVALPPVGSFLSADDLFGTDPNAAFSGFGAFSDQGTDLDAAFSPTLQPLGFDPDFLKVPGGRRDEPDDQGQFGIALQCFVPLWNASKISLYFVDYHSRLPLVNGRTADAAAVASTSDAAVDLRAASVGVSRADAELLALSDLANATRYDVTYPENIRMIGIGFSTATIDTGTLIAGELSYHFGWPVQVPKDEVITAALSPAAFTSPLSAGLRSTSLGAFGPDQTVKGWYAVDKAQLSLSLAQLLGPQLGADQSLLGFDVGWVHIDDLPGANPFDEDSWGYRLAGALTYEGVLGAFTVIPAVQWTHDVDGSTPGPGGAFVEHRKTFSASLEIRYTQRWSGSVGYVRNFGGTPFNVFEDRDLVRFQLIFEY